jgi:4-hydroxy-3-polyprenylbenzoate decarboxylase
MKKNKIIVAITGASGAIYAKVLLDKLQALHDQIDEVGIIMSDNAKYVWRTELDNENYNKYSIQVLRKDGF